MTEKMKNPLILKRVFQESWQTFFQYAILIILLPLLFTPIGIAIEKAISIIPDHGIHSMVAILLNMIYLAFLFLVHFAYLYALTHKGQWRTAFHALMLDDHQTIRKFFNYFIVNLKLILIMLLPSVLIVRSYGDTDVDRGLSLAVFFLASILYAVISAKFTFGLVIQLYGQGTRRERSLRLISAFSIPCYKKLVILEWMITVIIYLPKWTMAFYMQEQGMLSMIYDNYINLVLNFIVSIWIVKAYDQLYRTKVHEQQESEIKRTTK